MNIGSSVARAISAAITLLLCSSLAMAQPPLADGISQEKATQIAKKIMQARPDLLVEKVQASKIAGVFAVEISNGPTVYASENGDHFIAGDLYAVRSTGIVNLAEEQRQGQRVEKMKILRKEDMIVFAPADGKTKAAVTVFTDIDCGYCRKLHLEVPELNRLGVEVRYLAYPRAGVGSPSYDKLVTAWCASDPKKALTRLKNNERVENKSCGNNPVAAQFELGQQMGVAGTPALVTETGQLLPGYMPAAQLAATLGVK